MGVGEMYVRGDLDRDGYEQLRERTQTELRAVDAEMAWLQAQKQAPPRPPFEQVLARIGGWSAALQGAKAVDQRAVLACLMERVVPVRRPGHYYLDITWTPLGAALREAASSVVRLPLAGPVPVVGVDVLPRLASSR